MSNKSNTKKLNDIFKNIKTQDVKKLGLFMLTMVVKRAFPSSGRAKGSDGKGFPNLDPKYKAYKSGRVRYSSPAARNRAMSRRRNSDSRVVFSKASSRSGGKTGRVVKGSASGAKGPRSEGRRLGPRSPLPNNQLSGNTMLRLHVKTRGKNAALLFFTDRGNIGAHLEARKRWIVPTQPEQVKLRDRLGEIIKKQVDDIPKDLINFDLGTITF